MQILLDNFNHMILEIGSIEKGFFPEADPNTELYKITNKNGNFYAVANGFMIYEVLDEDVPEDYHNYSYTPEEGFVYHELPKTEEEIKENMQQQITDVQLAITELYESML